MRRDWKQTVRAGSDIALIGFGMLLFALPVVTLGAALGAGSAAVHHWCGHGDLPRLRTALRWYVRGILPGLAATVCAAPLAALLAVNLWAARTGAVPGGVPLVAATLLVTVAALGVAALTVVRVGALEGRHWARALRQALSAGRALPASAGIAVLAALLAMLLPATVPLVAGCALFALHVVSRRYGMR